MSLLITMPLLMAMPLIIVLFLWSELLLLRLIVWLLRGCRGLLRPCIRLIIGPGDDLVEFSSIEPDTAAFGTVIDLHPLTLGHDEVYGSTYWAFHDDFSFCCWCVVSIFIVPRVTR